MPRLFIDTLIGQIPRVQAQLSMIMSEAALFPYLTPEERTAQRSVWQQILSGAAKIITDVRKAILEGDVTYEELTELNPQGITIAHDFTTVLRFFGDDATG